MNLIPTAIVDAIAGKIARSITPSLQASLKDIASNISHPPTRSFVQKLIPRDTGTGGSQSSGSSSSSPAANRLPPVRSQDKLAPSVVKQMIQVAERRTAIEQKKSGPAFWQRGWGTLKSGKKRSAFARATRLTSIAQKRLTSARLAVRESNKQKDQPGWHPAAHGALLTAQRAAQQKLTQATSLQSRATFAGALGSNRVASGLMSLVGKIPALASRLAIPVAVVAAAIRAPFQLSRLNDARIESQRDAQRFSSRLMTAFAKYDVKTENLKALTARDTAGSTEFLINQQNKLRENLRPIQAGFKNVLNYAQGGLTAAANKFAEGWQLQFDLAAAADRVLRNAAGGKIQSPIDAFNEIRDERAKKAKDDEKKQSQQFSDVFGSLAKGIIDPLNDARFNNVTKPPLRPIR